MPPRKKSMGRRSEPKLFRCTGFGDCDMVFTRSEHLARHARKHTGEKPFKCVVPGCDRMFSRFDNMMQHTQTHSRPSKKKSSKLGESARNRRNSTSAVNMNRGEEDLGSEHDVYKKHRSHSIQHPTTLPPSSQYQHPAFQSLQQQQQQSYYYQWQPPPPSHLQAQQQTLSPSPSPPLGIMGNTASMMESRTLPPPRRMSYGHAYYPPPPLSKSPSLPDSPEEPAASSFRSPYYPMPPPPSSAQASFYRRGSLQSVSTLSSGGSQSPRSYDGRRRLSAADLQAPIYSLQEDQRDDQVHPLAKSPPAVVDITSDEYEALQGFGKFSSQGKEKLDGSDSSDNDDRKSTSASSSPSLSAQVSAFRQKLMPIQESFQRPVRSNAV